MSARTTDNGDGTVTVMLKWPIETASKKLLRSVSLRTECTVADLQAMDAGKGDVDKTMRLVAQLSEISAERPGVSMAMLRKMRSSDWLVLSKLASDAIGAGDEDGDGEEGKSESQLTGEAS